MDDAIESFIKSCTFAHKVTQKETIQGLWSGYGKIVRYEVIGGTVPSVVVKYIKSSPDKDHPRGWNSSISHQRKIRSYEVETQWYRKFNQHTNESCRTANCFGTMQHSDASIIVLENLNDSGFSLRKQSASIKDMKACLDWLAHFHAKFMEVSPSGLWETGTYWHLATRPEELAALQDQKLKTAAPQIDYMLNHCRFKTLVHGDAKVANFCFHKLGHDVPNSVAAVDFQYVGAGCGMKDVAYFIGSCLDDQGCEIHENELLDYYFNALELALKLALKLPLKQACSPSLNTKKIKYSFTDLEKEWRLLFPLAWTDFHRFLKGWSPNHWKLTDYSERMAHTVINRLTKAHSTLTLPALQVLAETAAIAAKDAGQYLTKVRNQKHQIMHKKGGNTLSSQVVTAADLKSQEIILSHLKKSITNHDLGLLTEELLDDQSRLNKAYFWCIDPLDGTLPFTEGKGGYAVSIALIKQDGTPIIGVVYDPENKVLYQGIQGNGVYKNHKKWSPNDHAKQNDLLFFSNRSFKKLPSYSIVKRQLKKIAFLLGKKEVIESRFAGSVMNAIWTLENYPACYLALPKKEPGGGSIWDYAATACIYKELGLPVSNFWGKELLLNQTDSTFMNSQGVFFTSEKKIKQTLLPSVQKLLLGTSP